MIYFFLDSQMSNGIIFKESTHLHQFNPILDKTLAGRSKDKGGKKYPPLKIVLLLGLRVNNMAQLFLKNTNSLNSNPIRLS